VDRLDILHFATRAQLNGRNYLAPIGQPDRILDVGCGTGQWAYELCNEFPDAVVVGLDLAPSKPGRPANYRFVRANVLQGLPFRDDEFEFVHQRLLVSGVPVTDWPAVVADLVRVTRPRGWVELVESMPFVEPEGSATRRLFEIFGRLGREVGHDTMGHVQRALGRYLQTAGSVSVQARTMALPIGEWGDQVGAWMAAGLRSLFTRLGPIFEAKYGLPEAECRALTAAMFEECEALKSTITFHIAFGQRPG
jgi:SAM-dependent methyltransferase